jgi:hypothetical protein
VEWYKVYLDKRRRREVLSFSEELMLLLEESVQQANM